jgi:hypothetical protein
MIIPVINIKKGKTTLTFPNYDNLIESRKAYWFANNQDRYQQFVKHLDIAHDHEKYLEQLYDFYPGLLKGAHLVFGTLRDTRVAMENTNLRHKIRNGFIRFHIDILEEDKLVKVQAIEYNSGARYHLIDYRIQHQFFDVAVPKT